MRRLWRTAPLLTAGLVVSLAVAFVFAGRLVLDAVYWRDPRHQDVTIAPWMTPRYVAHSWDVPPEVIRAALGIDPRQERRGPVSLRALAEAQEIPLPELIARLEVAIAAYRAAHPEARPDE
jgi:hypothetical protein